MLDETPVRSRLDVELERLVLTRRAAYRRVIAVLKARKQPFVIGGSLGLSVWLDRLCDGELELLLPPPEAPSALQAMAKAGFKVDHPDGDGWRARVNFGSHSIVIVWGLPPPLGGPLDEAWFAAARRTRLLDLRVRVAPLEELAWVRIATAGGASLADEAVQQALLRAAGRLDWDRFLGRLVGQEALLLAHVFLLHHGNPEAARTAFPPAIVARLLDRIGWLNSSTSANVETPC